MQRGAAIGALMVGIFGAACARPKAAAEPRPARAMPGETVRWHAWGDEAFAQAKREGKLVLVDVGIEGCTACRWMYEGTYRDPDVVARLRDSFVAVAVDADVQPDLGVRFEEWGWPATIVMTPDREQVLALRGSRAADAFLEILEDVVARKKAGTLGAPPRAHGKSATPKKGSLGEACLRITRALDRDTNAKHGGWTDDGPQYIQGASIEEAFLRAKVEGRPELRAHALLTLEGYAKMLDPVWGGVYVAAHAADFSDAIVEKRLVQEAEAMRSFALAYSATHEEKWKQRAAEIDRYLAGFLLAPDGTFYSTQEDEAPGLAPGMSARAYFELPDAERRKYGVPPVDHAVYTDQNAQAIEAYAMLFEATGEAAMRDRAIRAANAILATRLDASGFVRQTAAASPASDARKRAFHAQPMAYLTAQAHFGQALVALHRATGDTRWIDAARSLAASTLGLLEDRQSGGLFASTNDASDPRAEKPVYENVVAARFFHAVGVYTHDDAMKHSAERTLLGSGASYGAFTALAVQDLTLGPVEITVTGSSSDARALALYEAARATHEPRKALHWDNAHAYPVRGRPALYVCTKTSCSPPVFDPAKVPGVVASASDTRRSSCE